MSRDRGPSLFDVAESHKLPEQLTEKPPQTINSEPAYLVPDPELGPALDLSPDFHVPHLGETVDGIGVFVGSFIDEHGMTWWCFIEGCWRSLYDRPMRSGANTAGLT